MSKMVRRSFISCNLGHLAGAWRKKLLSNEEDDEVFMRDFFFFLSNNLNYRQLGFTGVALALELGETTGNIHVQGYVEHTQKRFTTLGKNLSMDPSAFSTVVDSKGAHAYCTGTGVHQGKIALARFEFGEFKLHGDTQKADLKMLVGLALDGAQASDLFREYPYAWCVHRDRMLKFYEDKLRWHRPSSPRPKGTPSKKGFSDDENNSGGAVDVTGPP